MTLRTLGIASAAIVAAFGASGIQAEEAEEAGEAGPSLDEIVVTAQRKSERTLDMPIAVQALGGERLDERGVKSLSDLGQVTPGFNYSIAGNQPSVALRGSSGEVQGIAGDPAIQVSLDGVPYASQEYLAAGFLDVDRIEVLRGPQGTVAGRNSTGGAINILSNRPTSTFSAALNGTYGNYNTRLFDGFVSGPLVGDGELNARLAFKVNYRSGILDNTSPSNPGHFGSDASERTARVSFEHAPTDSPFTALLTGEIYKNATTGAAQRYEGTSNPNGEVVDATALLVGGRIVPILPTNHPVNGFDSLQVDQPFREGGPRIDLTTKGATLRLKYGFGSDWSLTSISGYRAYDLFSRLNADASASSAWAGQQPETARQLSEELTLTGSITPDLDVLLGGLYLNQHGRVDLDVNYYPTGILVYLQPGFTGFHVHDNQNLTSEAGFGQILWRFLPKFQLTVGGRYTRDKKTFDETVWAPTPTTFAVNNALLGLPTPVEKTFSDFTPRVAIDFKPIRNMTFYMSYAEGFKAGGFNVGALLSTGQPNPFNPEKNKTYEVGAKTRWLDDTLSANLTAFRSKSTDVQVQFTTALGEEVQNAASATVNGVELELEARPTSAWRFGLNATYLDAKYDKFCPLNANRPDLFATYPPLTAAECGLPAGTPPVFGSQNDAGQRLARSPEWSGAASAAHTWNLGRTGQFTLESVYNFTSKIFFTSYHEDNASQNGYGLLDFRGTYGSEDGHWLVAGYVKNATDKRYVTNIVPDPIGLAQLTKPGNPGSLIPGVALIGAVGDPRTYGVTVGYRY